MTMTFGLTRERGGVPRGEAPARPQERGLAALAQLEEDHLGDGLEGLENARALGGDGLEDRLPLAHELTLHLLDWQGRWEVALVELQDVGGGAQVVALLLEVEVEVAEALEVGLHAGGLRVGDENHAVHALQDQLARGVVEHLAGDGVEVEARAEAADLAQVEGQKVEEQGAVGLGGE